MKQLLRHVHYAFTLIELLVVIAIITVLAALITPALHSALEQAKEISCTNNMKQMYLALSSYTSDNNGYLPSSHIEKWRYNHFAVALIPYYGAGVVNAVSPSPSQTQTLSKYLACPAEDFSQVQSTSQQYIGSPIITNYMLTSITSETLIQGRSKWGGASTACITGGWGKSKALRQISNNSVITTEMYVSSYDTSNSVRGFGPENWLNATSIVYYYFNGTSSHRPFVPSYIHRGTCSFLFLEGNIRTLGLDHEFNYDWQLK